MISRRTLLAAAPAWLASTSALAGPSAQQRKLDNRLELWGNYARRSTNLMARVSTKRETSLLEEPLLSTGTLVFVAPDRLVIREDGRQGATTTIEQTAIRITLNGREPGDDSAITADTRPSARWLAQRLLAAFSPGDGSELVANSRAQVPKGRGYRIELLPPRGSIARRQLRGVTLHLDPVAGSITRIVIAEAQGDRFELGLSDHRQALPDEDIEAFMQRG